MSGAEAGAAEIDRQHERSDQEDGVITPRIRSFILKLPAYLQRSLVS